MNNGGRQNEKKKENGRRWVNMLYKPPKNDVCDRVDRNSFARDNVRHDCSWCWL